MFSLFLVYEGSAELGPVTICRVADDSLTRNVASRALAKVTQTAEALRLVDDEASADAFSEAGRLRSVLETI
jgi:hypothetical protein